MNRRAFVTFATVGLIGGFTRFSLGNVRSERKSSFTTWEPKDFDCPVCKTKNTFQVWASYGSYIYSWPSKYQWVFWPWTDSPSVYLCKQCYLSTFLGDFDKVPKEKAGAFGKQLSKLAFNRKFKDYMEVPMSERLEIAENVYVWLERKDDGFWNFFNRVKGYHYGKENQPQKAAEARRKALELTLKMINDPINKMPVKELLYISGSMKHFLNDDKGALDDFKKGLTTKFVAADLSPKELSDSESGMNERFNDYIKQIGSSKPPRSSDASPD